MQSSKARTRWLRRRQDRAPVLLCWLVPLRRLGRKTKKGLQGPQTGTKRALRATAVVAMTMPATTAADSLQLAAGPMVQTGSRAATPMVVTRRLRAILSPHNR